MGKATPGVPSSLYAPGDVLEAHSAWGASCGPAALAALLGEPVNGLHNLFPKPWTSPTAMKNALAIRGQDYWVHPALAEAQLSWVPAALARRPLRGLAFLQLRGPWDSAPERAQYRHTHWVAFAQLGEGASLAHFVYDVNGGGPQQQGGWERFQVWRSFTLQRILRAHRGASGLWRVRLTLEFRP